MSSLAPRKHDVLSNGSQPVAAPRPAGRQRDANSRILAEDVFSYFLVTERGRSDRSNRPFVLLSVQAKDRRDLVSSTAGQAAIEALLATTRDTDVLGWVEGPRVI